METFRPRDFVAPRAWGALDVAQLDGVTVRMHWTNEPYRWHVNDGSEVFVVLSGVVDMRFKVGDETRSVRLEAGDVFRADDGDAHVAEPVGEARVLVIERAGSV